MFQKSDYHIQGPQISQFNNISPAPVPRSSFKRDFTRRTTFNASYLVPIFLDEILPGDEVHVKMNAFTRMATPIKPLMDNLYQETHWFFIPNRLVWEHWEQFQGQKTNPDDSVTYQIPVLDYSKAPLNSTGFLVESIYDYFGLPTEVTGLNAVNCLFNRAYDLIWNEWFRDENLQNSITVPTGDGPDDPGSYVLRKRNKRKDYFTSGLPWPQKGDAVTIGLGGIANIIAAGPLTVASSGVAPTFNGVGSNLTLKGYGNNQTPATWSANAANSNAIFGSTTGLQVPVTETQGKLTVDLDESTAVTINALRQAALYQQILELDARGGTRYVESIYSRFGVVSPDFRLQRPELIGQGSTRINAYAVPQTAPTDGTSPQGNLAAFATSVINGNHGCRYAATEHGMIIGLMSVRADLTYQQGLPRMFSRRTRLDYYEPLLNGLGEQAVPNKEIFAQGTPDDLVTFCFQERFAEYRFKNSEITGKFRSTYAQSLDIWHLSQEFGSLPALNSSFIEENVPMNRVLAVTDESDFLSDIFFEYNHVRPMPIRSNPGITRL